MKRKVTRYKPEEKQEILQQLWTEIENGLSTSKACDKIGLNLGTFFGWRNEDTDISAAYRRANDVRVQRKFDSIEDDYTSEGSIDHHGKLDPAWVKLQQLKIDAKKWELSKMKPSQYSNSIDVTTGGKGLPPSAISVNIIAASDPDE